MSAATSIEWTERTWNPVTGCTKVSSGCKNCYAEAVAERFWRTQYPPTGTAACPPAGELRARRFTDVWTHPDRLEEPLRWRKPSRIFVNSMSDLFHEDVPLTFIGMVLDVISRAPQHVFQVLTKRPARMLEIARDWKNPLPNLHLGVSVENQETADERIVLLLQTPAAVRFLSVEPMLGPVDLRPMLGLRCAGCGISGADPLAKWCAVGGGFTDGHEVDDGIEPVPCGPFRRVPGEGVDWVIVGGESGPGARACDVAWIRSIVAQCKAAGVPCFVKQVGANVRTRNDSLATDDPPAYDDTWPEPPCGWDDGARGNIERIDDGYQGAPVRIRLRDRKGGDPAEWPADLRIRQFPEVRP